MSNRSEHNCNIRQTIPGYWQLIGAGEPFRLLFPLGALIGITGVLMWPLFIWNIVGSYPGPIHARVMIEGFLTAFVIGFLGTALPRLLDVPRWKLWETLGFAAAILGLTLLHLNRQILLGDQLFFLTLLTLLGSLGVRALLFRKDVPPPAFVLVLLGLVCALVGVGIGILQNAFPSLVPAWGLPLGKLLLNQGYIVLPIMGIGAFLLPRFFGLPNRQSFPECLSFPPGWFGKAAFALFCGSLVLLGFVVEVMGNLRWGNGLRMVGIVLYFYREVPFHRAGFGGGSLSLGLRLALVSIPLAYGLMSFWPERTFSFLHVLLITGFSLLTLIVASRVVLGHSGQSYKFGMTSWPVLVLIALITMAMLGRVSADWMPETRLDHYAYAAVLWVSAVLVWGVSILPGVRLPDEEV